MTVRLLVSQACRQLDSGQEISYHSVTQVLQLVQQLNQQTKPPLEPPIYEKEMLDLCETEGNPQNGGGSFLIDKDNSGAVLVKFDPGLGTSGPRNSIVPGDIGSPVPGTSIPAAGGITSPISSKQYLSSVSMSPQKGF